MAEAIAELERLLPSLISTANHSEIWSIPLETPSAQRDLVLRKYLTANKDSVPAAADAIAATLKWRSEFNPVAAMAEPHDESKFGGLGFVTSVDASAAGDVVKAGGGGRKAVVTWNVYGSVKEHAATFGDTDLFLRWRVGLMERGVAALRLMEGGLDPPSADIAIVQVHDYLDVSLRLPAETRAATKKTIEVLGAHYPEMLSRKYFVNVPVVMGWMFSAMKAFMAKETVAKFQVLSYGSYVAAELGREVPKVYGGDGPSLEEQGMPVPAVPSAESKSTVNEPKITATAN